MKKYDVALALATTRDTEKLALARMILDMMDLKELYEQLNFDGSFEDLKNLKPEDIFKILEIDPKMRLSKLEDELVLKNYDVALAIAAAGDVNTARRIMESLNPKSKLSDKDIAYFDIKNLKEQLDIWKMNDLHDRLFEWLIYKNLPEPDIPPDDKEYYREVTVGWRTYLGIDAPIPFVMRDEYRKMMYSLSDRYPVYPTLKMKFIDFVCIIGDRAWVIEGKRILSKSAIDQVEKYYILFARDYPQFNVKKAIVCEDLNPKYIEICKQKGIEVFCMRD